MKQAQNYLEKVSSDLPDLSKRQFSDFVLLGKLAERPSTER